MTDADHLLVSVNGSSWHHPSEDNPDLPDCRMATEVSDYRRHRPEIARDWYEQCTYCAGEYDNGSDTSETWPPSPGTEGEA